MNSEEKPKEIPILFKGEMVRAILDGRKTQTRRIVKFQKMHGDFGRPDPDNAWVDKSYECARYRNVSCLKVPYGTKESNCGATTQRHFPQWSFGDKLWVKETFIPKASGTIYRADYDPMESAGLSGMYGGWKPSLFMPRKESRATLEVLSVRVERLLDITDAGAIAEGVEKHGGWWYDYEFQDHAQLTAKSSYLSLWELINGRGSVLTNPFVWVIKFKRL